MEKCSFTGSFSPYEKKISAETNKSTANVNKILSGFNPANNLLTDKIELRA
jgi:hypothetical protein